jgi:hypothetical protein
MKKIFYFVATSAFLFGCAEDAPNGDEATGSIYGIITDKATGEPVRSAGVKLNPIGTTHTTGSEGQYEFTELTAGDYTINVTTTGYSDLLNYKVTVAAGKTNKGDVQLEKLPPSLRVVNDSKQNIGTIDFGSATDDVARSFSIFNEGPESLEWEMTETSGWIATVSKTSGTLKAGAAQAIVLTIDREKLVGGVNTTTIHITSDNGSKQLTVKATGENKVLPTLNTLEISDISQSTAIFHGRITEVGTPPYSNRGFVYSTSSMPTIKTTIKNLTAAITENNDYTAIATGLTLGVTYYVRAYAISKVDTAYSTNEVSFTTAMVLPTVTTQEVTNKSIVAGAVTFNGTIVDEGDPAYTERGFVYGVVHNPTVENGLKEEASGSGVGVFSSNLTGLIEGNIYYVRAYAINDKDPAYGQEVVCNFTAIMPEVLTEGVTKTSTTSVLFTGSIKRIGDPPYTERGFVYSTLPTPSIENGIKIEASGEGTSKYSYSMEGLTLGTTYYVIAYAANNAGAVYGKVVPFAISPYTVLGDFMIQNEDAGIQTHEEAATACQESVMAGYDDWRLPSTDELDIIYATRSVINLETNGSYWSSSALTSTYPCCPLCPGSSTRMCTKTIGYYYYNMGTGKTAVGSSANARCVRTLP